MNYGNCWIQWGLNSYIVWIHPLSSVNCVCITLCDSDLLVLAYSASVLQGSTSLLPWQATFLSIRMIGWPIRHQKSLFYPPPIFCQIFLIEDGRIRKHGLGILHYRFQGQIGLIYGICLDSQSLQSYDDLLIFLARLNNAIITLQDNPIFQTSILRPLFLILPCSKRKPP